MSLKSATRGPDGGEGGLTRPTGTCLGLRAVSQAQLPRKEGAGSRPASLLAHGSLTVPVRVAPQRRRGDRC